MVKICFSIFLVLCAYSENMFKVFLHCIVGEYVISILSYLKMRQKSLSAYGDYGHFRGFFYTKSSPNTPKVFWPARRIHLKHTYFAADKEYAIDTRSCLSRQTFDQNLKIFGLYTPIRPPNL